jgi:major membrane immunogen (membrane-anchored lipoprotein)
MLKRTLGICGITACLAISLVACGASDEAKCRELLLSNFPDGKIPPQFKNDFEEGVKQCVAARKFAK